MDDVHRASLDDTKKDTRRVRRGLGKGSGVLLRGVMASFLSKDALVTMTEIVPLSTAIFIDAR